MRTRAFTLVEVMVVLLIIAIAVAAVSLRLQGPLAQSQMKDLTGRITQFDSLTRTYARSHDQPLQVLVDLNGGTITRSEDSGAKTIGQALELPPEYRIERVLLPGQELWGGQAILSYSRRGLARTCAIKLRQKTSGLGQWIVLAGLSGEVVEPSNDQEVKDILAAVQGPDAR